MKSLGLGLHEKSVYITVSFGECPRNISLPKQIKPISQLRFDYDTTTTKNWHVHFLLVSNRVEWKQARAIRRSRIVVESQL